MFNFGQQLMNQILFSIHAAVTASDPQAEMVY